MTMYMPLFRSCSTSRTLTQLHAHLFVTGLHNDPLATTKLVESYAKMGSIQSARLVFETHPTPDSFMWGVLIKCHVWRGFFQDAISLYHDMLHRLNQLSSFIYPSILRAASRHGDLDTGQKLHGRIIKCGLDSDPVVETSLLSMYGETACLGYARKLFDEMPTRDLVSWSSIISSCIQNGHSIEGLKIFHGMILQGIEPDSVTILSVAEACGELGLWRSAKSIHGFVVRREIKSDGPLDSSLIAMYGKCGDICSAENLFDNVVLHYRTISSWTSMITSYNQNGYYSEAVKTFSNMLECNVEPNAVTMMNVLCSCARLRWLPGGKSIHGFVIRNSIDLDNDLLGSALIDLYANCGKLRDCHKIFDSTRDTHVVSWNMLISGYAREGMSEEALMLFVQMPKNGVNPDSFTLSSVISACGNIGFHRLGMQVHCRVVKTGLSNEFVQNSLIDMYSKCGFVDSAYTIFHDIKQKSVITWNSMICGYSQNGNFVEALNLFDHMHSNCLEMDEVTFLGAIHACSNLGFLEKGKWVHHKLITLGVREDAYTNTALTDMYAKCGELQLAQTVFDTMSERSIASWSAMIGGYAVHGRIKDAISLFDTMVESGIRPNDVTFMNILSACSHAGYVEEGKKYFNSMRGFKIEPKSEHFACLIDLLSRAGDLSSAYKIINSMPFRVDASVWGALLNGCRIHRQIDMIKTIQQKLENMDIDDSGYYTLLSNVFAEGGDWDKFRSVRSSMKNMGLRKVYGCSMI